MARAGERQVADVDRLRDIYADITRILSAMSPRERMLVAFAGVAAFIFVGSIALTTVQGATARKEASIEEKKMALEQIAVYARSYGDNERTRKEVEARLGGTPVRLMSLMQDLADKNGLTIGSMNDRGESNLDDVKESVVEVSIASAPVAKLVSILNEIEKNPRPVKVRKMRVKPNSSDETLNVTLTVASYQLTKS